MTIKEWLKKNINKVLSNNIAIGMAIGFLIPFIAWIIDFLASGISISFKGFYLLHTLHPSLLFIDLFPFIIGASIYFISYFREKEIKSFEEIINQKDETINRNAEFAKKIGNREYSSNFAALDENDILGRSLLLMRDNLIASSRKETEENWISEGKELISGILRMHNNVNDLTYDVLVNLIKYINVVQGAVYIYDNDKKVLVNLATYAYNRRKTINQEFQIGQGLIGQCAYEMDYIYRTEIPDDYITLTSGILGDKKPCSILLVPLISDEQLQGVLEFASLEEIPELNIAFLKELGLIIARTIFNLKVNQRTEKLLMEAQEMTRELQENEEQLKQNAEEMRATQEELEKSNIKLETQIKAVENAQKRLHSLLENASEIIMIYDKDLKMTFVSPSVNKILGFTSEEMMRGKDMERLTRKGEMEFQKMLDTLLISPDEPITIQYTFIKKDGNKLFLETTGRNFLTDSAIKGIILNSQDITARKKAEQEERMRSRMQSLSENSLDMIIRLNTQGQFFYANPVVEDYLSLKPLEVMNKKLKELHLPVVFLQYFTELIDKMKVTPSKNHTQITIPIQMGEKYIERIMSLDAIPEFSENENELETILVVGHDITESKRIEKEVQDKNKKIEDSINYAQRIQTSILPNSNSLHKVFPKSFMYYVPRDVVSGDFPWFFTKDDYVYIAVVDCTGHGVPGALLSFVAYFTLNSVVDHDNGLSASKIIDMLHFKVRQTLNQDKPDATQRDGMDIAFCKYNIKTKELQYSGAHRSLYLLSKGELQEFKGDKKPIGGIPHLKKTEKDFSNYVIKIKEKDKIFFFSDGLPDQIGGEEGKKYSNQKIRENITLNPEFTMTQYHNLFSKDMKEWTQNYKQIDDILLIGIEF